MDYVQDVQGLKKFKMFKMFKDSKVDQAQKSLDNERAGGKYENDFHVAAWTWFNAGLVYCPVNQSCLFMVMINNEEEVDENDNDDNKHDDDLVGHWAL